MLYVSLGKDGGSIRKNDGPRLEKDFSGWVLSNLGRIFAATEVMFNLQAR